MEGDCPNGISMGVLSHRIYYGNAIAQDLLSPSLISRLIAIRLLDGQGVGRGKWGGKEIVSIADYTD